MSATHKKKLIEVALPLDAINAAAGRENNIHTGLPANLHTWWARKPLGVARAVLFASLTDDPSEYSKSPAEEARNRDRLFALIEKLADVRQGMKPGVLRDARAEILKSNGGQMPSFWDPFCGGGSLPLEALRLGLNTTATDLKPVAVFITRILIELAPRHARKTPINPHDRKSFLASPEAPFDGLKNDVLYYGGRIGEKLFARLSGFYPSSDLPKEFGRRQANIVAWIWARTVTCPNPSCRAAAPLVNKFWLSTHKGNESFVHPTFDPVTKKFRFAIRHAGTPLDGTVNRSGAMCLACENPISFDHIRVQGTAGRISYTLMAMAAEGPRGRLYLCPDNRHDEIAAACVPSAEPDSELPSSALGFRVQKYGLTRHSDLFTKRQLTALEVLADEVANIRSEIILDSGGDNSYADLVQAFLALSLSRVAQTNNTLVRWLIRPTGTSKGTPAFDRPIVSMVWEFSEGNILGSSVGSWQAALRNPLTALSCLPFEPNTGVARQADAALHSTDITNAAISTDPPYFDAIGYADLADFFYIWLRRAMGNVHPDIFGTMLVPKDGDMTVALGRKDVSRSDATQVFLERLYQAFGKVHLATSHTTPVSIYYAFKQTETATSSDGDGSAIIRSTGWETLLQGVIRSGFQITGTWPLRTESASRLRAIGSNALASSILLVCRPRECEAGTATRRQFLNSLRAKLPPALSHLQSGNVAPVDLAQASIGPGMAVYSSYDRVLDADGSELSVGNALTLINQSLDEVLADQEADFDPDTRWAVSWFEQTGFEEGEFGQAETLSKAKNTSINGLVGAGIVVSTRGRVRLLRPEELEKNWDPSKDKRLTVWEVVHFLVRELDSSELNAAQMIKRLGPIAEVGRELAYRLFSIAERKKWPKDALTYNALVLAWPEIARLAREMPTPPEAPVQGTLI
ncbi:MAG: DUF1156 domain-containing protein [Deltaproteobacteria bacterium]|nr:DUF1156 domain-containing protein [Deltaproteobacteria bacterium]